MFGPACNVTLAAVPNQKLRTLYGEVQTVRVHTTGFNDDADTMRRLDLIEKAEAVDGLVCLLYLQLLYLHTHAASPIKVRTESTSLAVLVLFRTFSMMILRVV